MLFFVYAAHFLGLCSEVIRPVIAPLKPDGTSFNTQNSIPHKSQKTKGFLETSRAKECQRGIAGAAERAKEGNRVPSESSDTRLGARCREFESPHSDQKPPQNIGFEAVFITFQAIIYLAFYINRVSNVGKALLLICFAFSP